VSPEELRTTIREKQATVVAFTHVETSTGAMAPLAEYADVIRDEGAKSIVDGVAAFGGVDENMARLGIDVLVTGAQKAFGVPPGLAIVAASAAAWRKRLDRESPVGSYYADLARWQPVMREPDKYFSTHAVNLIYALARALEIVLAEGTNERYERHRSIAQVFRSEMTRLGFEIFTDAGYLAPTLSVFRTPRGTPSNAFRDRLQSAGVVAAGGIGDPEDRIVRFGHMGNITNAEIAVTLQAVRSALEPAAK
jgi:aspartate aminotransferase-like enzyme